jgi:hypothetical protein
MANSQKKNNQNDQNSQQPGDPLFNLKHAQVEAELEQQAGDLAPIYRNAENDGDDDLDEGPRDSQGLRRGENDNLSGSTAGKH